MVQSVSDVHVVGELLPQGRLELSLGFDGLQSLTQLALCDFLQTNGILQLAVQELGVFLQTTELMLQTLELNLDEKASFQSNTHTLNGYVPRKCSSETD